MLGLKILSHYNGRNYAYRRNNRGIKLEIFISPKSNKIGQDNNIAFELPKGPSIAVLPLTNMTGDPEQENFCDGITENTISTYLLNANLYGYS